MIYQTWLSGSMGNPPSSITVEQNHFQTYILFYTYLVYLSSLSPNHLDD